MKTVLITGANKSIGYEIARQLAKNDYYIYLGSRNPENGQQAVAQLNAEGITQIEAIEIDVSSPESIEAARQVIGQKTAVLDVLINNAGIRGSVPQPASTANLAMIRQVFDTNFFGAIQVTQAFLDLLQKSEAPRIVNVTSGLASLTLHSDPSWKHYAVKGAAYGPSKTALNAYTVVLAYELRDSAFKVNAVDPGYTATDFNDHQGKGTVEDAASHVVKYALLDENGPTGGFFSLDNDPVTGVSPW
jgi:NAD(P)-dependent dehydrogenase (short-subunit alcohol dehydrogenase family)